LCSITEAGRGVLVGLYILLLAHCLVGDPPCVEAFGGDAGLGVLILLANRVCCIFRIVPGAGIVFLRIEEGVGFGRFGERRESGSGVDIFQSCPGINRFVRHVNKQTLTHKPNSLEFT